MSWNVNRALLEFLQLKKVKRSSESWWSRVFLQQSVVKSVFFSPPSDRHRSSNVFKHVTLSKVEWSFPGGAAAAREWLRVCDG